MPVSPTGEIIKDDGTLTGGQVNLTTGQVTQPSAIAVDSLGQNQNPLNVPVIPPPTSFTGQIDSSLQSLLEAFNTPTAVESEQTDIKSKILSSLGMLGTEATRKQELEQKAGLEGQRTELQNVINQLQGLSKEAQAIPLQIQQESEGRGRTKAATSVLEAGRLRENAIKSLGLAAIGQTLQGNISLAESSIQNALQAEFEPERLKLQTLERIYEMNKDALERVDKKRSDNLNILLGERERILNLEEKDRQYTASLMLQAAQMGASTKILQEMYNSTPEGAIALGSQFLGAEFKQKAEQQAFDNGIRTKELAIKEAALAIDRRKNLIELAKLGDKSAITELGYDPKNLPLTDDELRVFEEQKINIEKDIKDIQNALDNAVGLNASTGLIRGKLSATFSGLGTGTIGAGGGLVAGPVGAVVGGVGGFTAGAAYTTQKKNSFMGTARYVVNNLRLNKVGELADAGIKLNPISEAELVLMGEASKRLAALGDYDEMGGLRGFKGTASEVKEEFETVLEHYNRALAEINKEMLLSASDIDEINSTK